MIRCLAVLLVAAWLAGCAASPANVTPYEHALPAAPDKLLRVVAEVLMEDGYVIRHADGDLGRLEAVLSRWPGYRVQIRVTGVGDASRIGVVALRGERPLPPDTLDPLLMSIEQRLDLAP